jgi:hypothetical protein
MEQLENSKSEYPLLLKVLLAVAALFLGSLIVLVLSIILSMVTYIYGLSNLLGITVAMEQIGLLILGLSIALGGGVSIIGLTMRSISPSMDSQTQYEKQKNKNRAYDIRDDGLTVDDVLDDLSMQERELLTEKLAKSRLAIRDDGTLIPLEQAETTVKVERFIDG